MSITPHDHGTFLVSSRSRPEMEHLVDAAYQDEPNRKPHFACGCESNFIHGRICPHILAVIDYAKTQEANQASIQAPSF